MAGCPNLGHATSLITSPLPFYVQAAAGADARDVPKRRRALPLVAGPEQPGQQPETESGT